MSDADLLTDALRRLFAEWLSDARAEVTAYLQAHPSASPATVARDCPRTLRPEVAAWLMAATKPKD